MHNQPFDFAQLASHLDRNKFNYLVRKYQGDKYIKNFPCWNQLKVLMFDQLSRRESLRDLIVAVEAHSGKAKFLCFGNSVTRSNLAKANQNRDCCIFEEYVYYMMEPARNLKDTTIFNLGGSIYAFNSTTVELCLAVFCWAKFRRKKGGIKIHTLYDVEAQVPAFFHITTASVHDAKAMKEIPGRVRFILHLRPCVQLLCTAVSLPLCRGFLRGESQEEPPVQGYQMEEKNAKKRIV